MAALYPKGIGGTIDSLATGEPFYGVDCVVWYVKSTTGVDAAAPAGKDKEAPLATLGQAVTNASANDVIVLLDGHSETMTAAVTLSKRGMVVVGSGQTSGVPNVTIGNDSAAASALSITAQNVQLRNIKFTANAQANAAARVAISSSGAVINGCYFQCAANDDGPAVGLASGADYCEVANTTFISTGTTQATRPESALKTTAAVTGLRLRGAVFSDGTVGFTNLYALDLNGGAVTDGLVDSVSLLLGASLRLGASFTGYVIPTITGGGLVDV